MKSEQERRALLHDPITPDPIDALRERIERCPRCKIFKHPSLDCDICNEQGVNRDRKDNMEE